MERAPVPVARLAEDSLQGTMPCCLDMLVKLPGGHFVLPEPYRSHPGIDAFMKACARFEDTLVDGWRDTHYAYLTVDSRSHRSGEWHFDGMQGARYPKKLLVCHHYVLSDRAPFKLVPRSLHEGLARPIEDSGWEGAKTFSA